MTASGSPPASCSTSPGSTSFTSAPSESWRRIAVVPFGAIDRLVQIEGVDWHMLKRPRLVDARSCSAIVADFGADLPDEWEAFLADAALAGRIVYQVKQLSESLTGRVELEHLSENSFGSLLPAKGYVYLKGAVDFLCAVFVLPFALPVMAAAALAIRLDSTGPALFRQKRVGHSGKRITVYKFRTMRQVEASRGTQRGDDPGGRRPHHPGRPGAPQSSASTSFPRSSTS